MVVGWEALLLDVGMGLFGTVSFCQVGLTSGASIATHLIRAGSMSQLFVETDGLVADMLGIC